MRDLCQQIHDMYKSNDVARVTTEMYLSDMQPAMKPSDAFACMAHREIDRVEIDQLEGRVTSVLLTPYPPGIPLLIPGERFNRTIVQFLQFARKFNQQFPGFDTDIHGLVEEKRRRQTALLTSTASARASGRFAVAARHEPGYQISTLRQRTVGAAGRRRATAGRRGSFADDVALPGQAHVCFLRSPHPHARMLCYRRQAPRRRCPA